ncbi:MAG: YopX family protein [Pseudomonadota bacterium]|jgi:uncharacterized phage protein (TIGR01671 family)
MSREIKFRVWYPVEWDESGYKPTHFKMTHDWAFEEWLPINDLLKNGLPDGSSIMQYTGRRTVQGKEIYEGDIVFVEESNNYGDKRYYLVIVWIPEWTMFASLHLDEYKKFLEQGTDSLDEFMFWTYTLQDSEKSFHYAGNIYENPQLLNKE